MLYLMRGNEDNGNNGEQHDHRFALVTDSIFLLSPNGYFIPDQPATTLLLLSLHLLFHIFMPIEQQSQQPSQQKDTATTKQPSKHGHAASQTQPAPRKVRFNVGSCSPFSFANFLIFTRNYSQVLSTRSSMS